MIFLCRSSGPRFASHRTTKTRCPHTGEYNRSTRGPVSPLPLLWMHVVWTAMRTKVVVTAVRSGIVAGSQSFGSISCWLLPSLNVSSTFHVSSLSLHVFVTTILSTVVAPSNWSRIHEPMGSAPHPVAQWAHGELLLFVAMAASQACFGSCQGLSELAVQVAACVVRNADFTLARQGFRQRTEQRNNGGTRPSPPWLASPAGFGQGPWQPYKPSQNLAKTAVSQGREGSPFPPSLFPFFFPFSLPPPFFLGVFY